MLRLVIAWIALGGLLFSFEPFKADASIWKLRDFNRVAKELYGQKRFATIAKDDRIEVVAPRHTVDNPSEFMIGVKTSIPARSVALIHSGVGRSLIAFFRVNAHMVVHYELSVRHLMKGTLFAVVEGEDGRLYYNNTYLDVPILGCMAVGGGTSQE